MRRATVRDREAVLTLYRVASRSDFSTWNEDYPAYTEIDGDVAAGTLYLLEDETGLVAAASRVPENELADCPFWTPVEHPCELARVAVRSDRQGQGIGRAMLAAAEDACRRDGFDGIRLLVALKNEPARRLYEGAGYRARGRVFLYGIDFLALDKQI